MTDDKTPADQLTASSELRREHAKMFEPIAHVYGIQLGLVAADVRVWLGMAFGALAYLPEWYDPSGPMSTNELADRMSGALVSVLALGH